MASLGWVTPGEATEGVTPLFFPENPGDLFLVASSAVSPLAFSSQNRATFFAHRCHYHYRFLLLSLGCHPPPGCHPTPFLPARPRFSTILCKFAHKIVFPSGVTPLRVSPGTVRPLVTPLASASLIFFRFYGSILTTLYFCFISLCLVAVWQTDFQEYEYVNERTDGRTDEQMNFVIMSIVSFAALLQTKLHIMKAAMYQPVYCMS